MHADRATLGESCGEIVALKHPGDGQFRCYLDDIREAQLAEPFAVEDDPGLGGIENEAVLIVVGLRVLADLLFGKLGSSDGLAAGIADGGREVADYDDDLVAEVLKLPHLAQHDRVPDVDIRRRRVQPELDFERLTGLGGLRAT